MKNTKTIGLGTAAIGRPLYINVKQPAETTPFSLQEFKEKGLQVLDDAYQKGIRHFDTAPGYGIAEELLLNWLKTKNDSTINVSTKWGYTYIANFNPEATEHEIKEHSLDKLNQQWAVSKQLLPYLKVYQIHSATLESGVLENNAVLERLHQLKKEHNIILGFTTTGANQTEVLAKGLAVTVAGEALFQSVQCTFNILDQSVLEYASALHKLSGPVIIKEALANGRLLPNVKFASYKKLYAFINLLATKYKVDADAVALRYCMDMFPNATVLSGANNNIHLSANIKATQFYLSELELAQLTDFGILSETYWQERKQLTWN